MEKLVFFDIDGTLVTRNNHIPESTIKAVEQLKENNITPVIATGRPPILLKEIAEKLGINSFISMNGQYIVHHGELIYSSPLDMAHVHEIVEISTQYNHGVVLCAEEELIVNSIFSLLTRGTLFQFMKGIVGIIPDRIKFTLFNRLLKNKPKKSDYEKEDIYMVSVQAGLGAEQDYQDLFDELTFTRANKHSMDIVNKGVSKASGIEKMLSILKVSRDHTYAFGDGLNDLEMLEYVGTGIAMDNGFEELKEAADYVTASVFDDGIVKGLKKFNLL